MSHPQAVVWTDEAIDQLLDRSTLGQEGGEGGGGAAGTGTGGSDILAGFKVRLDGVCRVAWGRQGCAVRGSLGHAPLAHARHAATR